MKWGQGMEWLLTQTARLGRPTGVCGSFLPTCGIFIAIDTARCDTRLISKQFQETLAMFDGLIEYVG